MNEKKERMILLASQLYTLGYAVEDARAELQRLQVQKFLTPRQAEAVDVQKILRLFSSPLGKTLLSAKTLRREFKFSILTDAEAYSPEAAGEQVMLQGVVDCFWQEADGIVILDFKTDYIDGDLQLKAARYAPQLQAYARALSLIYGLPVRKCILYFFSAGKTALFRGAHVRMRAFRQAMPSARKRGYGPAPWYRGRGRSRHGPPGSSRRPRSGSRR